MSDTDIHAAVYCPECGAKVKYQFPPGVGQERTKAMLRALAFHYMDAGHPVP